jgi:general secretion pathway protein D
MAAYAPSNAIIISDLAANIERIRVIIENMDQSAVQQTDIVTLEYAVAEDVVRMLDELTKTEAKQAGAAEPEVWLVPDKRTNSVLVSGDELERARIRSLIKHLDTPLEQSGNVKVVYLEYAQATDIAEVLTRVMQNINKLDPEDKSRRAGKSAATIEADEGTNALIITADASEMQSLEAVIQRLDIRRAQVLVEAIIAELEIIDGQDLGVQWLFRDSNGAFGSNVVDGNSRTGGIADGLFPDPSTPEDPDNGGDFEFDRGTLLKALAGTPGFTLGWGELGENLDIAVILNALNSQKNANILSTPSLLTLDNQEAYITVGQNVPFVTGSYTSTGGTTSPNNPFQTIERENVGITLKVTPHVNEGDSVVLDISQEVSSLTGALSLLASDIITNERKVETKVMAGDGRTVVLGGLIKEDVQDAQQKVPLLGDIPWLGRLFRSDSVAMTHSNLLIFIKPTIIREESELEGATAQKYRYIRTQQQRRIDGGGVEFLEDEDIPLLPAWEEQIKQLEEIKETAAAADGGEG